MDTAEQTPGPAAGYTAETLEFTCDGRERRARVVVPAVLPADPGLLVFFHGSRQSGNVMRNFTAHTFDELACRLGCVIAYPDGVGRHFNDARRALPEKTRELGVDDVSFTRALIGRLAADHGVDTARVTGLGYSNGGQMVMRLLRDAPGLLAAAVVFAATWPQPGHELPEVRLPGDSARAPRWRPTPVLFMHGTADPLAPYGGGAVGIDERSYRGHALSAPANAVRFARLNGLTGASAVTRPAAGVRVTRWAEPADPDGGARGRSDAAPVELWTLEGAGHVIPSGTETAQMLGPDCFSVRAADAVAGFLAGSD